MHLSVEGGQEFLFHRLRWTTRDRAVAEFDHGERMIVGHAFDVDILRSSRDLIATGYIRGRDAVHAATALCAGFDAIVRCDADVDGIPGPARLDPTSGAGDVLRLGVVELPRAGRHVEVTGCTGAAQVMGAGPS